MFDFHRTDTREINHVVPVARRQRLALQTCRIVENEQKAFRETYKLKKKIRRSERNVLMKQVPSDRVTCQKHMAPRERAESSALRTQQFLGVGIGNCYTTT